jgi:DNA-binding NarL/FixJ family response regulator
MDQYSNSEHLSAAEPPRKPPLRVFLVEDLPVVRNRIIESLEEIDGLEVAGFAESEDSALSWLRSHPATC